MSFQRLIVETMEQHPAKIQTILIVEDDDFIGEMMAMAISYETPYASLLVKSGKDAMRTLLTAKPCLIILDYYLLDMTGIELYDRMYTEYKLSDVVTVLMSAGSHQAEAQPRNIVEFAKPFDMDKFIQMLEKLITSPPICSPG